MSQREQVRTMLEQAGVTGVTSNQFFQSYLPRFSARIHELRNEGLNIVKEPVEEGHWRYTLIGGDGVSTSCPVTSDQPRSDCLVHPPLPGGAVISGREPEAVRTKGKSPEPVRGSTGSGELQLFPDPSPSFLDVDVAA